MHIEPTFHDHLEAIVAVAKADAKAVDSAHVGTTLSGLATDAERLLVNLEAGGLLCAQRGPRGRLPAYRLHGGRKRSGWMRSRRWRTQRIRPHA